ncbi:hypothetical protein MMC13_003733 [Lambiella insularis]|nr:hypothetical protein [Lambiella insularis]
MLSTGTPEAFTRRYAAPEVLDCDPRNNKSDIFSLGCVFLEIWAALTDDGLEGLEGFLQGNPDFPTDIIYASVTNQATHWARKTLESGTDDELATSLAWCMKMMDSDQKKRPNIIQAYADIYKTTKDREIEENYYCQHCLIGAGNGASGDPQSVEQSGEVLERGQHNFSERQQADPREIYRSLRQEAHDELENINQRRLEEVPNPPLFDAIRHGETEEVRRLLDEEGIEATSECKGKSALHWAADNGFQDIAKLLADRGAELNGRDSSKMTPLHWAAFENYPELVQYFLELGADFDTVDQWGDSPLEDAKGRYQNQVVALLEAADRKEFGRKVSVPETEELLSRVASMSSQSTLSPARTPPLSAGSTTSASHQSSNTTGSLSNIAEAFEQTDAGRAQHSTEPPRARAKLGSDVGRAPHVSTEPSQSHATRDREVVDELARFAITPAVNVQSPTGS